MSNWLLKTEPDCYSWDDFARDKKTTWDGVSNATALIHLRKMRKGDRAFIYHTGNERAVVGVAEVMRDPYPDPKLDDERLVVVELKPIEKLAQPVTLDDIKADPIFAGWDLLRISRLGVMSVPPAMWKRIERLARVRQPAVAKGTRR